MKITRFILGEIGTNTYVLESDGAFAVVDPAVENDELVSFLNNKNVKYILLTHGHFDHIGGVNALKAAFGAKVFVHSLDECMLLDGNKSLYNSHFGTSQKAIKADTLLDDGDEIMLGNEMIKVMHTPGHTLGSVCYILEDSRIILSGDTLFRLSAGRTDLAGISPLEAGRKEIASLSKIAALPGDYAVLPGHGDTTTLQFERDNNRYIRSRNASYGN